MDAMAQRILELEARVTQLRNRLAVLEREAGSFTVSARHELDML